jgi:glyoxylase-like metal-dependent hydrolase (beta-lactamase superfamily II)
MIKKLLTLGATLVASIGITACSGLQSKSATELDLHVYYPQGQSLFPVTSTLITGPNEAILVDAQFQKNDAENLVNLIRASGKQLTTIYISHGDPDYYFGLDVLAAAFPEARIVATPATVAKIAKTMKGKQIYWGPILKDNAPKKLILPQALTTDLLSIDGKSIQIIGFNGHDPDHTFAWIPSEKTVLGGVVLSENMHIWMADNKTTESRNKWIKTLDMMTALDPQRVIAGHFIGDTKADTRIIEFTKTYIQHFEQATNESINAAQLTEKMEALYPKDLNADSLEFSAKVVKGDIQWPQ